MGFVFYDTETTGVSTDFDQILQFAAIRTDEDLIELDRFEIRCRLQPHVLPHPGALRVTGMSFERVSDRSLPSHYEMVRAIVERLSAWSPAVFVGYNSMRFDEQLLRQALFQTLHPPYLTNTGGNCRADALALVQVAAAIDCDCIVVPHHEGKPLYKLDRIAPANGFDHSNAHDALADVEATIHMARCVIERAPDCWDRFVRFSSKAAASSFVDDEDAFLLTEVYFNKPYHYVLCAFARDPGQASAALCLDLRHDPAQLAAMSDEDLAKLVKRSPKPVRRIRLNTAPALACLDDVPPELMGALGPVEIASRARAIRTDAALRERLVVAAVAAREERAASEHFEEQIYDGFASTEDSRRMARFHNAPWTDRLAVVEAIDDPRLRHFGRRVIFDHAEHLLLPEHRAEMHALVALRRSGNGDAGVKWTTARAAHDAAVELIAKGDPATLELLAGYNNYLAQLLG